MPRRPPRLPDIPGLPDIPSLGDIWDRVQSLVDQSTNAVFVALVGYIWQPIRPFLADVAKAAVSAANAGVATAQLTLTLSARLFWFFAHGPEVIAGWVVRGFLGWVDDVVDLVEDYIDGHWDDAV